MQLRSIAHFIFSANYLPIFYRRSYAWIWHSSETTVSLIVLLSKQIQTTHTGTHTVAHLQIAYKMCDGIRAIQLHSLAYAFPCRTKTPIMTNYAKHVYQMSISKSSMFNN